MIYYRLSIKGVQRCNHVFCIGEKKSIKNISQEVQNTDSINKLKWYQWLVQFLPFTHFPNFLSNRKGT